MRFGAFVVLAMFIVPAIAHAAPVLFGQTPENNTYTGKGIRTFTVNVTSPDLNLSSVLLFIISENAYQQKESWDNYTMQCTNAASNWTCTRTVSFAIAGTDTIEFFYFEAKDNNGETGRLGTATAPLRVTLDRNPPLISFVSPTNGSYVSNNITILVITSDSSSGVNASSAQYSFDNITWSNLTNNAAVVNTTSYSHNQSLTIYARVSDNVNNSNSTSANITIDKELPKLAIIAPANNSFFTGLATFSVNASDDTSDINIQSVRFVLANQQFPLFCAGTKNYTCTANIETSVYADNKYNLTFLIEDSAGNAVNASVTIMLKNSRPTVKVLNTNDALVKGIVTINASIANPDGAIANVTLQITKGSQTTLQAMSCNINFTLCEYFWDTPKFSDGPHALTVIANSVLNYSVTDAITLRVDNTKPTININVPDNVSRVFWLNATVADSNIDTGKVTFTANAVTRSMPCAYEASVLACAVQYDSAALADGPQKFDVTAVDHAGNSFTTSKTITIDNNPPNFVFLKISPLQLNRSGDVELTAGIEDIISTVKNVSAFVKRGTFIAKINLTRNGDVWTTKIFVDVWISRIFVDVSGTYNVDIEAYDTMGNAALYKDRGQFFVGLLACGDNKCQPEENYCLCANDCSPPACSSNQVVECSAGLPLCTTPARCGDNICSAAETCSSCSADCGACTSESAIPLSSKEVKPGTSQPGSAPGSPEPGVGNAISAIADIASSPLVMFPALIVIMTLVAIRVSKLRKPKPEHLWKD
ncbi:MAG: hypothetical protein HY514_02320 [Candidatus Aenigmarchaeota archaeon]|nr:hypothetical protein [Candidatus Aenigmarchaeota archaeon]